jgi:long-chain acyl-CoA synthetase
VTPHIDPATHLPRQVGDALETAIARDPDHEAVVGTDRRLTYGQLDVAVDHAASALFGLGVRKGDIVGVSLPNSTEIVVLFYAILRLGAIFLGLNRNLAPPEKSYILNDAGARLLLTDDLTVEHLESVVDIPLFASSSKQPGPWLPGDSANASAYSRPICNLDDVAGLAYTSGTTGHPKGVEHSHRNLLLAAASLVANRGYDSGLRRGDCAALTILNLQVTSTLLTAQAGGTQIAMDRVDPAGIAEWIREERINSWFGVPTMLYGLTNSGEVEVHDLATLRDIWTGGTHLSPSVRRSFEERFGHRVYATYGMTEVPTVVTIEPRDAQAVPGSSGTVLPQFLLEIRDDDVVLLAHQVGEITVRARPDGPWGGLYRPMLGYHGRPKETAETVRNGILYTGDIGEVDEVGNLLVRDRRQALILRGGSNVYPAEVERVVSEIQGVAGVAVVGIPDQRLGQRVAAAIELAPGSLLTIDEIKAHCNEHLARYKVPEEWRVAPLARNAMGKVIRTDLEKMFS